MLATSPGPFLLAGADGDTTLDLANVIVENHVPVVIDPRTGPGTYRVDNDGMIYWYNSNGDGITYDIGFIFTNKTKQNVVDGKIVPLAIGFFIDNNGNHKFDTDARYYQDGTWDDRMFPTWWLSNSLNYSVIRGMAVDDAWNSYEKSTTKDPGYWIDTAGNSLVNAALMGIGGAWGLALNALWGLAQWGLNALTTLSASDAMKRKTMNDVKRTTMPIDNIPYPCIPMRIHGDSGFVTLALPKMSFELTQTYSNSAAMETTDITKLIYEGGFLNIAEGVGVTYNDKVWEDLSDTLHLKLIVQGIEDANLESQLWEKGVTATYLRHVMYGWFAAAEIPAAIKDIKDQKGVDARIIPGITSDGKVFYSYVEAQNGQYPAGLYANPLPSVYGYFVPSGDNMVHPDWDANNPWPDPISRSVYVDGSGNSYYGVYGFNDYSPVPIQIDPLTLLDYNVCCLASAYQTGLAEESEYQTRILLQNEGVAIATSIVSLLVGMFMQGTFQMLSKLSSEQLLKLGFDSALQAQLVTFGTQLVIGQVVQPLVSAGIKLAALCLELAAFKGDSAALAQYQATTAGSLELSFRNFMGDQMGFWAFDVASRAYKRYQEKKAAGQLGQLQSKAVAASQDKVEAADDAMATTAKSEGEADAESLAILKMNPLILDSEIETTTSTITVVDKATLPIDAIQGDVAEISRAGAINNVDAITRATAFDHGNGNNYDALATKEICAFVSEDLQNSATNVVDPSSGDIAKDSLTALQGRVQDHCYKVLTDDSVGTLLPTTKYLVGHVIMQDGTDYTFAKAEELGMTSHSIYSDPLVKEVVFEDPENFQYEGGTKSASEYLQNGGNPWMIKKVSELYWPEDVKLDSNYKVTDAAGNVKQRVDAYAGNIASAVSENHISMEIKRGESTLVDFQGNGVRLPIGLWPEAIDHLLKWVPDSSAENGGTYQLNDNAIDLIKTGKIVNFADGSTSKFQVEYLKSDPTKLSEKYILRVLSSYYRGFGLEVFKDGNSITLKPQRVSNFFSQGACYVVPEVTENMMDQWETDAILARWGNGMTRDDLKLAMLYGAEQMGWEPFVGGSSKSLIRGLAGGAGEMQVATRVSVENMVMQYSVPDAETVEGNGLSIEPKKFLYESGGKGAEIDVLDSISRWDGEVRTYENAIALGQKYGRLNGNLEKSIFGNLFNLLSCAGTDDPESANIVQAIRRYSFETTSQNDKDWATVVQHFMFGGDVEKDGSIKYLKTESGNFITTFKVSDDVSVGIFKKNDGTFIRYEITRILEPTSSEMSYNIKSEVGIIDELAPDRTIDGKEVDCYGSATVEPSWKAGTTVDTSRWNDPLDVTVTQSLTSYSNIGKIAYDINAKIAGDAAQHFGRQEAEHLQAETADSQAIGVWMAGEIDVSSEKSGRYVRNGKLTTAGVIKMCEGLTQDDFAPLFISSPLLDNRFQADVSIFKATIKKSASQYTEFALDAPVTTSEGTILVQNRAKYYTVADVEVRNTEVQTIQDFVFSQEKRVKDYTDVMVGNGLVDLLQSPRDPLAARSLDDSRWHLTTKDASGNVIQEGTADRIVDLFDKTLADMSDSAILPAGLIDGLNKVDTLPIKQTLKSELDSLPFVEGDDFYTRVSTTTLKKVVNQVWLNAWQTLFAESIESFGKLGLDNVVALSTFDCTSKWAEVASARSEQLAAALMKASLAGSWIPSNSYVSLADVQTSMPGRTPIPRLQFEQSVLNMHFDVNDIVLGSDGYYYAHIKWFTTPTRDNIPREYVVSFAASGDFGTNGMYVYAEFTSSGVPETSDHGAAAPNHLYSTIPPSSIADFMNSISEGNPPPSPSEVGVIHFTSGYRDLSKPIPDVPYTMWDLIDPTMTLTGNLI